MNKTRNLVLCAVCAAITCVLAPLSIPLAAGVPISLATFAVMLAGVLLGGRLGAVSQLVYLLLGAVGLPVFAGWTGGADKIFGMTGGYLVGYIPLAWLTGLIYKRWGSAAKMSRRITFMIRSSSRSLCRTTYTSVFSEEKSFFTNSYVSPNIKSSMTPRLLPASFDDNGFNTFETPWQLFRSNLNQIFRNTIISKKIVDYSYLR
jgi:hypothetical protein